MITAIVEICIAGYLFKRIKDKRLYPIAIFVVMLALYQLTEFLLCTTSYGYLWARIGFAAHTFMPILLYHFFVNAADKEIKEWMYVFPIFFASLALFYPNFITHTSCNILNVTSENLIFNQNFTLMFAYLFYYLYCPVYGVYIFSKKIKFKKTNIKVKLGVAASSLGLLLGFLYYFWSAVREKNIAMTWIHTSFIILISALILILLSIFIVKKFKKWFYEANALILAITTISAIFMYYFIPNLTHNYASIFCQFAFLYSIAAILLINALHGKIVSSRKRK